MNTLLQLAQVSYGNSYVTSSDLTPEQSSAAAVIIIVFYIVTLAVAYVLNGIFLGRIFKKAGVASWAAWVPFYSNWKLLEIGGQQGFWAILVIVPIVSIVSLVFTLVAEYNVGLKLGKSSAFVLLAIFLPLVWLIWLAVDKSVWNESLGEPSRAVEHTATPSKAA
jgi:hypothetical protein